MKMFNLVPDATTTMSTKATLALSCCLSSAAAMTFSGAARVSTPCSLRSGLRNACMMADSSHKDRATVACLAALFATSLPSLGMASMAEPGSQASSRDAISGAISNAISASSTLVAETSLADQIWYELNRPPVTLSPFEVSPVGYVFVAMYASYLGWQIFRPASEAEIEIEVYTQLSEGTGAMPTGAQAHASDAQMEEQFTSEAFGALYVGVQTVKVHYEGKLADGTVFDSSIRRGEPTEFKVEQVIRGWQEGLQLMREGGKARLTIPASLAYGSYGSRTIPGNAALQFEVELLEVRDEGFKLPF